MHTGESVDDERGRRRLRAMDVVSRYAVLCAVATRIPLWWANSPSITALQLKMLSEISHIYGVDLVQDLARPLLASLAGGGLNLVISQNPLSVAAKAWVVTIPVVGIPLRFATGPAVLAAYTYVLGRAFIRHYEEGGTYHDFTTAKFRAEARELWHGARA